MTATVSRPATIDRTTSSWPGRKSSRPKVPRISCFSGRMEVRATDGHRAREMPLKHRQVLAPGLKYAPRAEEQQSRDSSGDDAPARGEQRREDRTMEQLHCKQREQYRRS